MMFCLQWLPKDKLIIWSIKYMKNKMKNKEQSMENILRNYLSGMEYYLRKHHLLMLLMQRITSLFH